METHFACYKISSIQDVWCYKLPFVHVGNKGSLNQPNIQCNTPVQLLSQKTSHNLRFNGIWGNGVQILRWLIWFQILDIFLENLYRTNDFPITLLETCNDSEASPFRNLDLNLWQDTSHVPTKTFMSRGKKCTFLINDISANVYKTRFFCPAIWTKFAGRYTYI